jgi:DNA-binding cell septation regulator SpoVG
MLKVTKVWVHKWPSGKLLGFADVQFSLDGGDESQMTWKGFKIFQGDNGIQVGLPQRKDEKGETDDNGKPKYHPVITITREEDGGPGNDLLEHIRAEIETAYHAKSDDSDRPKASKKPKASKNDSPGIMDDDIPF